MKRSLEYIVFLVLLFLALWFFVVGIILDYLKGAKYFTISQEPVTHDDLPTLTICLRATEKLMYGKDFKIKTLAWNGTKAGTMKEYRYLIDLFKGQNTYEFDGQRTAFLKQFEVDHRRNGASRLVRMARG